MSSGLYLCVDGGGTKTAAIVARVDGCKVIRYGKGVGGPSNLTNGLEGCLNNTREAISGALRDLDPSFEKLDSIADVEYRRIWMGYAGCARPGDHELLYPHLTLLLGTPKIKLTSDGELLTAPMTISTYISCITLICGTGSVAMLYRCEGASEVKRIGRSGGWGPVLGDEGSGWSMGREGIKSVLTYTANNMPLLPWHHTILEHFEVSDPNRLLSTAVSLTEGGSISSQAESERKKRIAGCARYVAEAQDEESNRIKRKVAMEVVDLLRPIVEREDVDPSNTLLSVTGGLGCSSFWGIVLALMEKEGWSWGHIERISNPSEDGLKALLASDDLAP